MGAIEQTVKPDAAVSSPEALSDFFFFKSIYSLYILIAIPLPFSSEKGSLLWVPPYSGHLVPAGLGTETQPGSPGKRRGSSGRHQSQRQSLF